MINDRKYEEISTPHVEDFCYMTDNTYTKEEVCFLLCCPYLISHVHATEACKPYGDECIGGGYGKRDS